ncbi:uncharacterized protein [Panulirus ornatus]|uniref:uncharacterized protein n=1 Tax=Panulirus ornatus TaxID=150431 RepID=UPI003A8BC142
MLRTVALVVAVLTVAASCARLEQRDDLQGLRSTDALSPHAVGKPRTPNQILDKIVAGALGYIKKLRWDVSKRVQNGLSDLPFQVDSDGKSSERFSIKNAKITGLGSLRRSKSARFSPDKTLLTGTVLLEDVRVSADYTVTFAGVGEAPAQVVSGRVTEREDKLFADVTVLLSNLVPQRIVSYKVRSGHDELESVTNLEGNKMKTLHTAGFRKALREVLDRTMALNMKVQINKAIKDMKSA